MTNIGAVETEGLEDRYGILIESIRIIDATAICRSARFECRYANARAPFSAPTDGGGGGFAGGGA